MNTTDERTPLDPTISEIRRLIDSISGRLDAIGMALDSIGQPPLTIPDDPLREYRTAGGRVAYATGHVDEVMVGDWVQRCHGDPEWHRVEDVQALPPSEWVNVRWRITYDGLAHDWAPTDAIRIATAPVPDPEPYR